MAACSYRRQRELGALGRELPHQRHRIDLAADRRISANHGALRQFEWQSTRGEGLCRGRTLLIAQGVTRFKRRRAELLLRLMRRVRHAVSRSAVVTHEKQVIRYSK